MGWKESERRIFVSRIYELKRQKEYAAMEEEAQTALERLPEDPLFEVLLLESYWLQGKRAAVLSGLKQVESRGSGLSEFHALKATVALENKDYHQALESYRQAQAIRPSDFYRKREAHCLVHLQRYEEALSLLRNLEAGRSDSYVLMSMAMAYEGMGNREEAGKCYEEILAQKPEDEFARSRLLRLKIFRKSPGKADQEMERLLRLPSQRADPSLLKVRAEQLKKEKRFDEAAEIFERLIQTGESGEVEYFRRMRTFSLYQGGNYEAAYPFLLEEFHLNPADPYVRSALIGSAKKLDRTQQLVNEFFAVARNTPHKFLFGVAKKLLKTQSRDEATGREPSGREDPG